MTVPEYALALHREQLAQIARVRALQDAIAAYANNRVSVGPWGHSTPKKAKTLPYKCNLAFDTSDKRNSHVKYHHP